ncbi:hypothetical protein ABG768_023790, partial [Culter alburnus]
STGEPGAGFSNLMPSHGTTSSGHCRHHLCRSSDLVGQLRYSQTNTDTEIEGSASAE